MGNVHRTSPRRAHYVAGAAPSATSTVPQVVQARRFVAAEIPAEQLANRGAQSPRVRPARLAIAVHAERA